MAALDAVLDDIAHRVAAIVVARLREGEPGMIDQNASPLGPRRHCAAAKRRMVRGEPGASKVGRRYLLSPEALNEELGRASRRGSAPEAASGLSPAEELRRELALIRGGRR